MKEWRQTITVICTVVLAFSALAALMQFELAAIRAEMSGEHAQMRAEMSGEHARMREEMSGEHDQMRGEHAAIRAQLNSIDRRTARIEGHLFGIEIVPDPADGLDNQRLEFGGIIAASRAGPVGDMIINGTCELDVLDEINFALRNGHVSEAAAFEGLKTRSERTNVMLTGRDAKTKFCEYADLVSGMRPVKHPFDAGIKADRVIDF